MSLLQSLSFTALIAIATTTAFAAEPLYDLVPLGFLEGGTISAARCINDAGQIVGSSRCGGSSSGAQAFIWDSYRGMDDLGDFSGGRGSEANSINANGRVVGSTVGSDGVSTAAVWTQDGGWTTIGLLDGDRESTATAINDFGSVVGWSFSASSSRGFIWDALNGMRSLGNCSPYDLNNHGSVVSDAGIWDAGAWESIGGQGFCINNHRQVGGGDASGAFIWDAKDGLRRLRPLTETGSTAVYGINDRAWLVGTTLATEGWYTHHALLWTDPNTVYDLNSLIQGGTRGWLLHSALSINNNGRIVGYGINPLGQTEAFLLNPVPEPSTIIALLPGIGWLGVTLRLKRQR